MLLYFHVDAIVCAHKPLESGNNLLEGLSLLRLDPLP